MKTYFTRTFRRAYLKRIVSHANLAKRFEERYDLFTENPANPILKDHKLGGKLRAFRAFSITGDIRVVYYVYEGTAYFIDVGTHNQVYSRN